MTSILTRLAGLPAPLMQVAVLGGTLALSAGSSSTKKTTGNAVTFTSPDCIASRPPDFEEMQKRHKTGCEFNGGILQAIFEKERRGCRKGTFRHRMRLSCEGAAFDMRFISERPSADAKPSITAEDRTAMQKILLEEQNRYRAELNLNPLQWSDRLAEFASEWTTRLVELGGTSVVSSDSKRTGQGENIWIGSWTVGSEIYTEIIRAWFEQKAQGSISADSRAQIIAGATTQLGCAIALSGDGKNLIAVCRYWPPVESKVGRKARYGHILQ